MTTEAPTIDLSGFTGTEAYHGYGSLIGSSLTDGTKYLAEQAGAYWLFDVIDSYLTQVKPTVHPFLVSKLTVSENGVATYTMTEGNDMDLAYQEIEWTDFPLEEIKIYTQHNGQRWIHLLPNEY